MRKTAVLGGSFNPFGINHQSIVRWLLEEGGFTEVVVVPAVAHAFKPDLLDYAHRVNMAELSVNDLKYGIPSLPKNTEVNVSMVERELLKRQAGPIRTYEVLQELQSYGFRKDLQFAIGPDILEELDKWEKVDQIKADFGFVEVPIHAVRATQLREMIRTGVKAWKNHVSISVRGYIERHNLYKDAA